MINTVTLVGNLGADPEFRYTPAGTPVARFSVAVNEYWTDRETGERRLRTNWFRVISFGRIAEIAGQYLTKGSKVAIRGRLRYREWEDREGNRRNLVEIRARELALLGGGKREEGIPPFAQEEILDEEKEGELNQKEGHDEQGIAGEAV